MNDLKYLINAAIEKEDRRIESIKLKLFREFTANTYLEDKTIDLLELLEKNVIYNNVYYNHDFIDNVNRIELKEIRQS
jgi:hypothetical protein